MKKATWIPLIIIIIGVCLALAGFAAGGLKGFWIDRGGIHLASAEQGNLVKVDENYAGFKDIELNVDFLDRITFKEGDGYSVRGQNYERYGGLKVSLDGDKLNVEARRIGRWLNIGLDELFNLNVNDSWLEITYPRGAHFGFVNANVSSGRVYVNGLDCDELYVDDSFGKVDVSTITCDRLTIKAASGDTSLTGAEVKRSVSVSNDFGKVSLTDVNAETISASLSSGDAKIKNVTASVLKAAADFGKVELDSATADSMTLKLSAGNLSANEVRAGDLSVNSSFGKVSIDRLELGGRCEIDCSSGDVSVSMNMSENDLSYELNTNAGSVNVDGRRSSGSVYNRNSGALASLYAKADFGSINLRFLK